MSNITYKFEAGSKQIQKIAVVGQFITIDSSTSEFMVRLQDGTSFPLDTADEINLGASFDQEKGYDLIIENIGTSENIIEMTISTVRVVRKRRVEIVNAQVISGEVEITNPHFGCQTDRFD